MSRWISCVRPDGAPLVTSRRMRSCVARGSMAYSAVTQPLPEFLSHGGTLVSTEAAHSTWVSPNLTRHEPSAWRITPRSSVTRAHLVEGAAGGAGDGHGRSCGLESGRSLANCGEGGQGLCGFT